MAHARKKVATALSEDSGRYLKTALALYSRSRTASLSNYGTMLITLLQGMSHFHQSTYQLCILRQESKIINRHISNTLP